MSAASGNRRPVAVGADFELAWAVVVPQLKRPPILFPLLATALVVCACRSPASLFPSSEAKPPTSTAAIAGGAVPLVPPIAPRAPAASPEEAAESASLALVRAVLASRAEHIPEPEREPLARVLVEAEREHGISVLLLMALIERESRFDPLAKGPRGSLGLMQVRPFVGEDVAARNGIPWQGAQTLLDPVANVRIGSSYLAELFARFGSRELALAAYNIGPTRLARRLARGNDRSPAFVGRVLREYEGLQREFSATEAGIGG
jgi:soluble lytic murein transglycosylase-like protein